MTNTDLLINRVIAGGALARAESEAAFASIIAGEVAEEQVERFLAAMADRGETVDEIVGAAGVLRRHVTPIACEVTHAVDTCGTGGDGISTFNVSTAAAIVAAAAGAKVAKHGNRSFTRRSGSAEALAALGVNVDAPPPAVARCIHEAGIGFLHAARLHPAMARVAEIRRRIGRRTIFNLLGPLTNPAGVHRQVVGVPRVDWMEKIAESLHRLGAVHALVVCGDGGLCDFTVTGPSRYIELRADRQRPHILSPADVGLRRASLDDLRVENPEQSAAMIRAILGGSPGPPRDHTLFNAAAALVVAGVAPDLAAGVRLAGFAIDDGAAARTLATLVRVSNEAA
jgi:anthranilate phosphoribosyltransferase